MRALRLAEVVQRADTTAGDCDPDLLDGLGVAVVLESARFFAGLYPSLRAFGIEPVEALRR